LNNPRQSFIVNLFFPQAQTSWSSTYFAQVLSRHPLLFPDGPCLGCMDCTWLDRRDLWLPG
jgi:hypothetical protein